MSPSRDNTMERTSRKYLSNRAACHVFGFMREKRSLSSWPEWRTNTDPEAVARIGIIGSGESKSHGAAGIAGHVEIVPAATDRPIIVGYQVRLLMSALWVEMIEHHFPDIAAHVGKSESVAASFAKMIDRRDERKTVAPRRAAQRPLAFAIG